MNAEVNMPSKDPLFCLLPGRFHGPWCWSFVRRELRKAGYEAFAPDLPIENPSMTLDDHAEVVRRAVLASGAKETIYAAWSWSANVALRAIGEVPVKKIIFIAGSFHPNTLSDPKTGETLPEHTIFYDAMLRAPGIGFRGLSRHVFYHDVEDKKLKKALAKRLRPHPRREVEPPLEIFPNLPVEYIVCTKDQALTSDSQYDTARVLGVKPETIESGHAPMLSQPQKIAEKLIELASR